MNGETYVVSVAVKDIDTNIADTLGHKYPHIIGKVISTQPTTFHPFRGR